MRLPAALHVSLAALVVGAAAGGLAGALEGFSSTVFARATLPAWSVGPLLVALGFSLGAICGAAITLFGTWLSRAIGLTRAVALLALAVVAYPAFAMFRGTRASRVPGHHLISVALVIVGAAALVLLARRFEKACRGRKSLWAWLLVAGLGLIALTVGNVAVLPRLYPWFHQSLGIMAMVAAGVCVTSAATLWMARGGGIGRPGLPALAVTLLVVAGAAGGWSYAMLGHRNAFRHAALNRIPSLQFVLRRFPLPRPQWLHATGGDAPVETVVQGSLPSGPVRPGADVVLITIDALRYDHVGAYGYKRPTTPNLDRLAQQSVRFQRAYAQAPHTSFSISTMLTGKYYPTLTRLGAAEAEEPVTTVLRRYGWKTAAFFPPAVFFVDGEQLAAFRDSDFQFEYVKREFLGAELRLAQVREYFERVNPDRAFVWLHYFEPHEPYDSRDGQDFGPRDVDRYDGEVAHVDAAVGQLIDYLDKTRPGAIIIVTADHGEEFGDHGGRYHGTTLYEEQVRVPLLVRIPGVAPHVVEGPVELVDLPSTILGLLNIPAPVRMRGDDLGPWLGDDPAPGDRLAPAFAELDQWRMIATAREKLICRLDQQSCQLFDLESDPGEAKDLVDTAPDRAARLRQRLDDWVMEQTRFEASRVTGSVDGVPAAIERGRLGDVGAAAELLDVIADEGITLPVKRVAAQTLAALQVPTSLGKRIESLLAQSGAAGGKVTDQEVVDWVAIASVRAGADSSRELVAALLAKAPRRVAPPVDADGGVATVPEAGPDIHLQAGLALAGRGDPRAVPELASAVQTQTCGTTPLCRSAIAALGKLGDARALPVLVGRLDDVLLRRDLVVALGELGDRRAIAPLGRHLVDDPYIPVRMAAARALAQIGGERALHSLRKAAEEQTDPLVLDALRSALASTPDASPPEGSRPGPNPGRPR